MMETPFDLPEWLKLTLPVTGAEGEDGDDDKGDDGDDGSDDGDDDDKGKDGKSGSDSDDADDEDDDEDEKDDGKLLKALREERKARRAAEKKAATLEREKTKGSKKYDSDLEATKEERDELKTKNEKLAAGYKRNAVDNAIEKAARAAKFRDPDDAVRLVDRAAIEVDQDEDDPSQVEIDEDTVKRAIKKLATAKKHLISSGTEDDEPSGSSFGGSKGKSKVKSEEDWKKTYSSL